ncbi:fimbrillin family protein [Bacteroides caecigallinarum]|uniref:fimbrillin family protein n=1 Tax=Bacteroides caecigallinarum TaxID=1411144 RepID=UPI001958221D|nr:fimbrillin family protein [Bacteroides caecigallinarum]MBM6962102.1 fimbrillin family protein [Bacteroides caecigallinarum]
MTTNFRLLAMAALAMLAMNSCVKEENLNNGEKKGTPVEFEMGVNSVSRTETPDDGYTTTFVEGDEVGIFVYNGEKAVVKNAHYKLNADRKWVAQGEAITAEEGVSYSYYAYYPYNAEATEATSVSLTVAGDQTTDYTGSDALMAKSENVAAGTTTVPLQYSHAFALVQVSLKGDLAAKDATVTLQNVYPTAALNLKAGTVSDASVTPGTVAMKPCSTNGNATPFNYRAIVPRQDIKAGDAILMAYSNGKNYKFTYNKDVPYESGKLRQFNVTLGTAPGETTIEIGEGTIANWEDGSTVEGGEGSTEVIVPTYIYPLGSTLADVINAPSFEEDTWFGLKRKADEPGNITYAIVEDEATTWGKAAKLSYTSTWNPTGGKDGTGAAVNNSWYLGTLGYYHCATDAPINGGIYKVTMKTKGENDDTGTISKVSFCCRSKDNAAAFSIATTISAINTHATNNSGSTIITKGQGTAETWEEFTFYINFGKKTDNTNPGGTTKLTDTTKDDYSVFDLRFYTNNPATAEVKSNTATIYISDVTIEPYVAE